MTSMTLHPNGWPPPGEAERPAVEVVGGHRRAEIDSHAEGLAGGEGARHGASHRHAANRGAVDGPGRGADRGGVKGVVTDTRFGYTPEGWGAVRAASSRWIPLFRRRTRHRGQLHRARRGPLRGGPGALGDIEILGMVVEVRWFPAGTCYLRPVRLSTYCSHRTSSNMRATVCAETKTAGPRS